MFLTVPAEIRDLIYDQIVEKRSMIAMRQTCHQIYNEAEDSCFKNFRYNFDWNSDFSYYFCLPFVSMTSPAPLDIYNERSQDKELLENVARYPMNLDKAMNIQHLLLNRFPSENLFDTSHTINTTHLCNGFRPLFPHLKTITIVAPFFNGRSITMHHREYNIDWSASPDLACVEKQLNVSSFSLHLHQDPKDVNTFSIPRKSYGVLESIIRYYECSARTWIRYKGRRRKNGFCSAERHPMLIAEKEMYQKHIMSAMSSLEGHLAIWDELTVALQRTAAVLEQLPSEKHLIETLPSPTAILNMIQKKENFVTYPMVADMEKQGGSWVLQNINGRPGSLARLPRKVYRPRRAKEAKKKAGQHKK
jgi:hypothetical protein